MTLDADILQLQVNLEVSIDNSLNIVELNENILNITNTSLDAVKAQLSALRIGGGLSSNIANQIKNLNNLKDNPEISAQKAVIKEQVIVLLVGTLQVYLAEIIKLVGNVQPELFKLSDNKEQITINQDMLNSGFKLGDAILEHIISRGHNFQDLNSSLRAFKKYFSIEIELDDDIKDNLILCASLRNCIVHNMSVIDKKFLMQIRETRYKSKYKLGESIIVNDEIIKNGKQAILDFADQITAAFVQEPPETKNT